MVIIFAAVLPLDCLYLFSDVASRKCDRMVEEEPEARRVANVRIVHVNHGFDMWVF